MKLIVIFLICLISCSSASVYRCFVIELPGILDCKIVNKDMTSANHTGLVEFDGDDEEFEDFTRVSIVETKLDGFPGEILTTFYKAKELILSENELSHWKPGYLENGEKLNWLYVAKNPITHLMKDAFIGAPNLETIEFIFCHLTNIEPNTFNNLPKLTTLR